MTCTIQTLFMMPDDVYTLFNYKRALKKKAFGVFPHFPDFLSGAVENCNFCLLHKLQVHLGLV